jgi:cytoskeletal protein RodZ
MVVIAALVWPALDKPFAAQRLRTSADQIRAELTRGRVAAMQSGRLHVFSVDPSTGRFLVHPADEATDNDATSPTTMSTTSTTPTVLRGQALPDGIRLQELLAVDDVTPLPQVAQAQTAALPTAAPSAPTTGANAAGPMTAPQSIYFHPDGTTSSARFTLANQHGVTLVLELRGLTGATRASEPIAAGAIP